jgi:DNA-binding Xre family transcriptional regulator
MIKVMIRQAAKRRGFKNAYQFGQSIGVKRMVASRLWKGEQLPKLQTLDRICNAWGCALDELIAHKRDMSSNGHTSPAARKKQTGTKAKVAK